MSCSDEPGQGGEAGRPQPRLLLRAAVMGGSPQAPPPAPPLRVSCSPPSWVPCGLLLPGRALPWTWTCTCDPLKVMAPRSRAAAPGPSGQMGTGDISEPALLLNVPIRGSARSGAVTSSGLVPVSLPWGLQ